MMSNFEIVQSYKHSKNPKEQIDILSMLNDCSKEEIVNILISEGCEVEIKPEKRKRKKLELQKVAEIVNPVDKSSIPVIDGKRYIKDFLQEHMANAMEEYERLKTELEEVKTMMDTLSILLKEV